MFDNFCLKEINKDKKIIGYRWPVEKPDYVVCLIHGIGEYAGRYEKVTAAMNEKNIAVVSMDLRGHGLTGGKRGHCAPRKEVLTDIDELISYAQEQYPDVPVILYGHSMGGNIAMDYRKRGLKNNELSGFVISAPWVELVRPVSGVLYFTVKTLAKFIPQMTISSGVSEGNASDNPLLHHRISLECAVDGFITGNMMAEGKLEDNQGAKGIPMLLMHGTADKTCSVNGSHKIAAVEDCEYVEWPGLFHQIHNGGENITGDEVVSRIIDWILAI